MTIAYPSGLPNVLSEGYAIQRVNPLMRTQLESGRARQRRRFTSVPTITNVSIILTQPEAQVFEGFYRWTLNDGSEWFDLNLKTPMGFKPYTCRFTEIYDGPNPLTPLLYKITGVLEIRDRETWSSIWIEFGTDYILYSNEIDVAMNETWPIL